MAQPEASVYCCDRRVFLRSPALPGELYLQYGGRDQTDEGTVLAALRTPGFLDMLYIASPTLADEAISFCEDPGSFTGKRRLGLFAAIVKYFSRATLRTTPFGAFAGIACAELSPEARGVALGPRVIRARADFQYVLKLVNQLEKDLEVLRCLSLSVNPALHESGERLYVCFRDEFGAGTSEAFSLRKTQPVEYVISQTRCPRAYRVLLEGLCQEFPLQTPEKLEAFLRELVANQVLLTTLRPPLTEYDPLGYVLDQIPGNFQTQEVGKARRIQGLVNQLNTPQNASVLPTLRQIGEILDFKSGTRQEFLQVDMVFQTQDASVPERLGEDAAQAGEALLRLSPEPARSARLAEYLNEYLEVYGNREMPLLEVLDAQLGLGPPAGYLNPPPRRGWPRQGQPSANDRRQALLAKLAASGLDCPSGEVELTPKELADLPLVEAELPNSLDLFAFLLPQRGASPGGADHRLLVSTIGTSSPSGRSLGRFAHLDPRISAYLASAGETESRHNPDVMLADILYVHQAGRANNVSLSPSVYPWQIVVGTNSARHESQIPLSDIWVGIKDGRFFLCSRRHRRRIVAYFNHMLSYLHAPNVVRFIAEASQDAVHKPATFTWGNFGQLPRLPRVVLSGGRAILSPMIWNLPRFRPGVRGAAWEEEFESWRSRWGVPQYVYMAESDNRLLLNLNNELHRGILRTLNHASAVRLEEALPAPTDGVAADPSGKAHVVELVLPLRKRTPARVAEVSRITAVDCRAGERKFLPGQGCLYFKLYGPRELRGDLLCELAGWLAADFPAERWFFIRYADPMDHLRLRVFSEDPSRLQECLAGSSSVFAGHLQRGLISRVCIDTYERELERYGGLAGIGPCEHIFCVDSRWAARLEATRRSVRIAELELGFFSVDMFLRGLGLDREQRGRLYESLHGRYGGSRQAQRKNVSRVFSESRKQLHALLSPVTLAQDTAVSFLNAWAAGFRHELGAPGQALRSVVAGGGLPSGPEEIFGSLIHMHCNRTGLEVASEHIVVSLLALAYRGFEHHVPEGVEL